VAFGSGPVRTHEELLEGWHGIAGNIADEIRSMRDLSPPEDVKVFFGRNPLDCLFLAGSLGRIDV
jgi:hypothetical protein